MALQDPQLLNEFFGRWEEVLNSVDAASQVITLPPADYAACVGAGGGREGGGVG